jgi:cyclopropane-fatty-acyl-phospholipid synthase
MPAYSLFAEFQDDLRLIADWGVNGKHYARTAEDWLRNMDANRAEIMPLFAKTYGEAEAGKWWVYWRVFFMACAELWRHGDGEEWLVGHYLFENRVR